MTRYEIDKWETEVNYKVPYSYYEVIDIKLSDETATLKDTIRFDDYDKAVEALNSMPTEYIYCNGKTHLTICELYKIEIDEDGDEIDSEIIDYSKLPELKYDEDIISDLIKTYETAPKYVQTLQDFEYYVMNEVDPDYAKECINIDSLIEEVADKFGLKDGEKNLKILLETGMSRHDAQRCIANDSAYIYEVDDFLKNFNEYAYADDEDDESANEYRAKLKAFLEAGIDGPFIDSDMVTYRGTKYFIQYCL